MKTILLFALPTTLLLAVAVAAHPQMPSVSPNAMKKISVRLEGCGKEYAYYDALRLTMEHNGAFKLPDDKSFKELNDLDLIQVLSWKTPQGKPGDYVKLTIDAREEEISLATVAQALARVEGLADPAKVKTIALHLNTYVHSYPK